MFRPKCITKVFKYRYQLLMVFLPVTETGHGETEYCIFHKINITIFKSDKQFSILIFTVESHSENTVVFQKAYKTKPKIPSTKDLYRIFIIYETSVIIYVFIRATCRLYFKD